MSKSKAIPKGTVIKDSITKHMDRRFISSIDLIGNGDVKMTIDRVEHLDGIEYANGNKDTNVNLLYFKETEKPLALNATNIKAIVSIMGSNKVADWEGKKIVLAVRKVQAFGSQKDAVRVIG